MQGRPAGEADFDMFGAGQVDDMFGDAPVGAPMPSQNAPKRGLLDNYDDSEGYYNFQVCDSRFSTHFSEDIAPPELLRESAR